MVSRFPLFKSLSFTFLNKNVENITVAWSKRSLNLSRRRNGIVELGEETEESTEEENGEDVADESNQPINGSNPSSVVLDINSGSSSTPPSFQSTSSEVSRPMQSWKEGDLSIMSSSTATSRPLDESGLSISSTNGSVDIEQAVAVSCRSVFYTADIDLMVMDNLIRDVRNFRDALNQLSFVLNSPALIIQGGFNQGNSSVCDTEPYNEQCVHVHRCFADVISELRLLMDHYPFLKCSDVLVPARCLTDAIKSVKELKLNEEDEVTISGRIGDSPHRRLSSACSTPTVPQSRYSTDQDDQQMDKINAAQAAIEKLQLAVAERAGEYLTWEMAQDENSMSKLSQSSEELHNSAANATSQPQQAATVQQDQSRRYQGGDSGVSTSSSTTGMSSSGLRSNGTGGNGAGPISFSASSSAISTPHVYQQRTVTKPASAIQRRHSAFHPGMKSPPDGAVSEQIDRVLERLDNGVELAFARAKAWSKYCKEILNYVHRRINVESEHARAVQKLVESTQAAIDEEQFLPLKDVYMTSFKVEHEFFDNCTDTMKRLYEYKYIKPLEARKLEQDRKRKELKMQWDRCNKQMQDAAAELKKSKQNFLARENNYKKARESSVKLELSSPDKWKIDKRRKTEEDAMLRRQQAAEDVRSLETKLEEKYDELERMKVKVLDEIRELIYQCDQTTKACTSAYFQALATLWSPLPAQYQNLSESCRAYIPGMEYAMYIKQLSHNPEATRNYGRASSDDLLPSIAINGHMVLAEKPSFLDIIHKRSLNLALVTTSHGQSSSSYIDSGDEGGSNNSSYDLAAAASMAPASSSKTGKPSTPRRSSGFSEAALTHRLQKVRLPTKCCHCDSYTFFQTVQCTECCMTWHKQCLPSLEVPCDVAKRMVSGAIQRRMSTRIFGAPLPPDGAIPIVLRNCVTELERRGCTVKGLYRVCGVKSKIEELCEQFERDTVDLSEVHPTNIASVVKLYLRQLPEAILTLKLYPLFVALAKEFPTDRAHSESGPGNASLVTQLKTLVQQLPKANYDTGKFLLLHLHRLTWFEMENQMTAGNLGIVFGPTLLRRDDGGGSQASLNSLLEAPLQTRAAELLIQHAYELFEADPTEDMERLGFSRRKAQDGKFSGKETDTNQRKTWRPRALDTRDPADAENSSNASESPRFGLDEGETMMPPRASTTPDLLKGSRNMHDRSLSIPASSSSEFTPESPDDSPERKTARRDSEWRVLLANAASREQRLHQALTVRRESSAPVGRRRATSPAELKSCVTISDDPAVFTTSSKVAESGAGSVPVASPESCGGTPVSTPMVTDRAGVGSPFQRAKGMVVRRVSSSHNKGSLVKRSTSVGRHCGADTASELGSERDAADGAAVWSADADCRARKTVQALKRGSAPLLEKKTFTAKSGTVDYGQVKRKSESGVYPTAIPSSPSSAMANDGKTALRRGNLSYI